MIIGKFKPVSRTNVPQAEDWIDDIVDPIVDQIKDLTTASQGQMSLYHNFNTEVREFDTMDDVWTNIDLKTLRGVPIGCQLLWWEYDDYPYFKWKIIDQARIAVKVKSLGTASTDATKIRIVVWGR